MSSAYVKFLFSIISPLIEKTIFLEKPNTNPSNSHKKKWREKLLHENRPILIAIGITGIAVIIGAIVFTNLYLSNDADKYPGDGDDTRKNIPINSSIGILVATVQIIRY